MDIIYLGTIYIDAGASTSWFIHGFDQSHTVTFAITIDYGGIGASVGPLNFSQGEHYKHVDGTYAQKIYFTNHDQFHLCGVNVYILQGTPQ